MMVAGVEVVALTEVALVALMLDPETLVVTSLMSGSILLLIELLLLFMRFLR